MASNRQAQGERNGLSPPGVHYHLTGFTEVLIAWAATAPTVAPQSLTA